MTEENTAAPETDRIKPDLPVQILSQYIKDLSFESPNTPEVFFGKMMPPKTDMHINVRARPIKDDMYEVLLLFRIEAHYEEKKKAAFIIELAYGALVNIGLPKEQHEAVTMVHVPQFLFPYAREVISNATSHGGFPQLLIQPINFEQIYVANQQQAAQQGQTNDSETNAEDGQEAKAE